MLNYHLYHCLAFSLSSALQFLSFIFKQSNIVSHRALHLLLQCGRETVLLLRNLKFIKYFCTFLHLLYIGAMIIFIFFHILIIFYYQGQSITFSQATCSGHAIKKLFLLPIHKVLFCK